MNDVHQPSVRPWWLAWFGAVVGCPLLAYLSVLVDPNNATPVLAFLGLGLVLNIPISIGLARGIASGHVAQGKPSGSVGLSIGLVLAGWAILGFSTFAGCMAAIMASDVHH